MSKLAPTLIGSYSSLYRDPTPASEKWCKPCVNSESTLHQLSPYIGKIKSSIANDLIKEFSNSGDLIVDPFSGAGTIPLEAKFLGRNVFAADISPYAKVLSKAKLLPPPTLDQALFSAEKLFRKAENENDPNWENIPDWIKRFFHPKTLMEAIKFSSACRKDGNNFLMACFLGILHHQRPGFLSYPSSHLVPYLRDKKFPKSEFPQMYDYRDLKPRMLAKLKRVYKRFPQERDGARIAFRQSSIENLSFPPAFDAVITSPPYMNALDYGRDNRLRLWFIDPMIKKKVDNPTTKTKDGFKRAITSLAKKTESGLKVGGNCVLIVGEKVSRSYEGHPSEIICDLFSRHATSLRLCNLIKDRIPDIRRSRKGCGSTKVEHILVFRRV